jgi:hypothetical protein
VIVVDNNCTDDTADVVAAAAPGCQSGPLSSRPRALPMREIGR